MQKITKKNFCAQIKSKLYFRLVSSSKDFNFSWINFQLGTILTEEKKKFKKYLNNNNNLLGFISVNVLSLFLSPANKTCIITICTVTLEFSLSYNAYSLIVNHLKKDPVIIAVKIHF